MRFVTSSALYSTSNIASFMADCKTIIIVYHLVPNMAVENRKYNLITFL